MLYAAKCYWPGVTQADLDSVAQRAAQAGPGPGRDRVAYLGSLLFAADDLVLCLFQGPSRAAVIKASERLGIPSERLMEPTWLPSDQPVPEGAQSPPLPGARSPLEWGAEARVRELLGPGATGIHVQVLTTDLCGASPAARVEFNRAYVGSTKAVFDRLDPAAQQTLAGELAGCLRQFNRATDGTLVASAQYLQVTATGAALPTTRQALRVPGSRHGPDNPASEVTRRPR